MFKWKDHADGALDPWSCFIGNMIFNKNNPSMSSLALPNQYPREDYIDKQSLIGQLHLAKLSCFCIIT